MSNICVQNLTFGYDGSYDNVFENVNININTSWKLGFIGRNGRGKTTFLRLLLGDFEYHGKIISDMDFAYFPYKVKDSSQLTLNIMHEMCPEAEDWEFIREVSLLDANVEILYRPFETLSNGEQIKVMMGALFTGENKFLLLDEPTNHLDINARTTISSYLKKKKGFILVSHDRVLLDSCIDHIISINRTNIDVQRGNFSSWWTNKQMQDNHELAENEKLKKEIKHLSVAAKRTAEWSAKSEGKKIGIDPRKTEKSISYRSNQSSKSKKMMSRAKQIQSRQESTKEEKKQLLKNIERSAPLKLSPETYVKDILISASNLSLYYDERQICSNLNFDIRQGDRIAVSGYNGSGKSTLFKLICGQAIKHTGSINIGTNLKISCVPQDTSHLNGFLADYSARYGIDDSLFKTILRKLDFERIQFEKRIEEFSEGQKKKVLIARSLCEKAHLYVWDEPLNYMDIISRMQIEELLLKYVPTMIFVEHDSVFQEKVATKFLNLSKV